MSDEEVLIVVFIGFVVGILNIILFFKVWGMTNNVAKILELMKDSRNKSESPVSNEISVGSRVFIRSKRKESRVVSIKHGMYECESEISDGWVERGDLDKI